MFYVISPPDETEWAYPQERLVELLKDHWPAAQVTVVEVVRDPARAVTWAIGSGDGELHGSQDQAGQAQYLDGPLPLIARYASWWRSMVGPEQPLVLYDEAHTTVVPLVESMTERDVMDRLEA